MSHTKDLPGELEREYSAGTNRDAGASSNSSPSDLHLREESRWSVFEHARDAMVICNPEGTILKSNSQVERIFGYPRKELVGEKLAKLISNQQRISDAEGEDELSPAILSGIKHGVSGIRKDGTELPIEIRFAELNAEEGRLVIGIIRDTTQNLATQSLQRQADYEKAISQITAKFINLPTERVDEEIINGLRALIGAVKAQRATVALHEEPAGDLLVTHACAAPGIPEFPKRFVRDLFPWLFEQILAKGETVNIANSESLPSSAVAEKRYMKTEGLTSCVAVPFRVGGNIIGGMSIDSFQEHETWDGAVVSLVQRTANVFANALSHKRADEKLRSAYKEIQTLKEQLEQENIYLREEIKLDYSHHAVVGNSVAIRDVLRKAEQVARTDTTVLVLGETGTGKELIARTIHELSSRNKRPMVKTNCAALPATLIESELFGREKGAYTGALAREIGRFELAHESTIFLDEIGELPPEVQSKLLRVLQEGEFERLGSAKTIKVNVRVIAATSRNLDQMVKEGKFREDLYYRLNVFPIILPPLRDRAEDIPALVWHILNEFGKRMGRKIEGVQSSTMKEFQRYSWPGNVRELRNVIERNLILNAGPVFKAELPAGETKASEQARSLEEVEAEYLRSVLRSTKWRVRGKGGAAEIVGLKPTTLESKLKKLSIQRPD